MLVPELSIAENMFLGSDLKTNRIGVVKWKEIYRETKRLLQELVGIDVDPHTKVKELGIAYQQMIEVARVLSRKIRILIMDEPTAALTEKEIQKLFTTIQALTEKGIAIVYISHRLEEIFQIGNNICVLRDGRLAGNMDTKKSSQNDLIQMMVGREIKDKFPKVNFDDIPKEEALRVEGLTREGVFSDVSFTARKGEVLGFAGLMGAGRTEIARAIFGADKLDAGRIFIHGKEVKIHNTRDAIRKGIALLPEDRKKQGHDCKPGKKQRKNGNTKEKQGRAAGCEIYQHAQNQRSRSAESSIDLVRRKPAKGRHCKMDLCGLGYPDSGRADEGD